ncbi:MAG: hypothetical protein ABIV47_03570 [Roseiflexaceae bacterium]
MNGPRSPDDTPARYQIQVRGTLDPRWSVWFDQLTISHDAEGNTLLAGSVRDQAALFGLLNRLRDLGMMLLAVVRDG